MPDHGRNATEFEDGPAGIPLSVVAWEAGLVCFRQPRQNRGGPSVWRRHMKIAIIGGGYVGLVSGACFAEFGVAVAVVEADESKRRMLLEGRIPESVKAGPT